MENKITFEQLNSICVALCNVAQEFIKNHNREDYRNIKDAYDIISDLEDKYLDKYLAENNG